MGTGEIGCQFCATQIKSRNEREKKSTNNKIAYRLNESNLRYTKQTV